MRWIGVALIVAGLVALAIGTFSYTKDEKKAELGPVEIRVEEKERVHVPVWVGILAVLAGAGLVAADLNKRKR